MLRLYVVAYFLLLTLNSGVVRGDLVNADSATVLVQVHLVSEESGTGSGSFITSDGHILTNYHVIEDALEISIYWKDSNSFIKARVAWQRPDLDLAILKIERTPRATISFPKDFASIQKGNEVFAFGYPSTQFRNMQTLEEDFSGVEPTLTTGIISRFSDGSVPLIQHTAEIRPGSSGGPLTDKCGRIIGVNTLGIGDEKTDYFSVDARSFFEEILKKIGSSIKTQACEQIPAAAPVSTPPPAQPVQEIKESGGLSEKTKIKVDSLDEPLPAQDMKESSPAVLLLLLAMTVAIILLVVFRGKQKAIQTLLPTTQVKAAEQSLKSQPLRLSGFSQDGFPISIKIPYDSSEMGNVIIGRDHRFCSHLIHSEGISKAHLRIFNNKSKIVIEDLNSTNGTYINDTKVSAFDPRPIKRGDQIKIGQIVLLASS
jgi:hypothetical protein